MKRSNLILAVAMSSLFAIGSVSAAEDAVVIKKARELQMAKKYDDAIKLYEASIKDNASERLYVDYASMLINLKKYNECDEMLTKASAIYPNSLRIKNALGMAKYKKGDLSGASGLFSQVLSKDFENKYAKTMLDTIRKEKVASDSPIGDLNNNKDLAGAGEDEGFGNSVSFSGTISFKVSNSLSQAEQEELAKKLYKQMMSLDESALTDFINLHKQVIEKCPQTDQAQESCWRLSNLFFVGVEPPDFENCKAVLSHLLSQYPDTPLMPDAKNRLILCCQKTEDYTAVCKLYEELFQKDPEPADPVIFMIRALEYGDALAGAGKTNEARSWYTKVLEKDDGKNSLQARAARRKLENL